MTKLREMGRKQGGYYMVGPTTGELVGCLGVVALFLIGVGVALTLLAPKVWAWIKPWLHAVSA